MALRSKEISVSNGYVTIRELRPTDLIYLNSLLGEQRKDATVYESYMVALSIVKTDLLPDDCVYKECIALDQNNPHNYITDIDENGNEVKELDKNFPDNYIVIKEKCFTKTYLDNKKPTKAELEERIDMGLADFTKITLEVAKMSEPNPYQLGK